MAIPANGGGAEEPLGRSVAFFKSGSKMGGRFHSTVPEEILAGGGPSSIGNPCPGQVHHRIETFQVGMILEGNPGMPRNPRAVGFGSHERENVVPLLRKALGARRAKHSGSPTDQNTHGG